MGIFVMLTERWRCFDCGRLTGTQCCTFIQSGLGFVTARLCLNCRVARLNVKRKP